MLQELQIHPALPIPVLSMLVAISQIQLFGKYTNPIRSQHA